jgi:hypothetical protein
MVDFQRISHGKIFDNFLDTKNFSDYNSNNLCVFPFIFERLIINLIFFIIPFIIGIHLMQYKKFLKLEKINITLFFRNFFCMDRSTRYMNFTTIIFIVMNLCYFFYIYISFSFTKFIIYLSIFIGIIIIIAIFSFKYRKTKVLSINIIAFTFISIPFINLHCNYCQILLGLVSGMFTYEYSINELNYKKIFYIFEDKSKVSRLSCNQDINMIFLTDKQSNINQTPGFLEIVTHKS